MADYLARLAGEAHERVRTGYYRNGPQVKRKKYSLKKKVQEHFPNNAIIAELKFASPSHGQIRLVDSPVQLAREMAEGGACALSILTATDQFQGDLKILSTISRLVNLPILMKDVIVSLAQLNAAVRAGADAVLLIQEVYAKGFSRYDMKDVIDEAHRLGLEVIAEASSPQGFNKLVQCQSDLFGINNRDLSNLNVNLETTSTVLSQCPRPRGPVVAESGIENADDVRRLRDAGADAFLVGTSIMRSNNVCEKVRELVTA